jgi:O-antigen/teichoic acid export membrane protein
MNESNKTLYKLTIYSNLIRTIIISVIGVVSVPLTLKYFGTEKYGVWSVINSFVVFLSMTNLGLNAAASILINKNSNYLSKITILKKSLNMIFVALPLTLIALALFNYIFPEWIKFINSPQAIEDEAKVATIIMIVFSILMLPFSLITSAINGFQKNYIENVFGVIGAVFSLLGILLVVYLKKDLIYLAFVISFTGLGLNIIKTIYFKYFIFKKLDIESQKEEEDNEETSYNVILVTGYRCMFGAIASMLVLNADNIVIAKFMGAEYVTPFSVTFKLYTIIFSLIYIFNSAIVPLIGRNITNRDYIKKLYDKTFLTITIIGGLFWVGTLAFGKTLIYLWVGKEGYAGMFVLLFLGAYSYVFSIVNLNYVIINTFNHIKGIVFVTWLEGGLNLVLSIILCKYYGLAGIAAGTFLGTFLSPFLLFPLVLKKRTENLIVQNNFFILKHFVISITPTIILAYFINQIEGRMLFVVFLTTMLCILYLGLSYLALSKENRDLKALFSREY